MAIRVVRIIEHVYADAETMVEDMAHWHMSPGRVYRANERHVIRAAALPFDVEELMPPWEYGEHRGGDAQ